MPETIICEVSNSCNSVYSSTSVLTVNELITITTQPLSQTGCPSSSLNIIALSTGNNLSYQWYKDGLASGPDNPVYPIASFAAGDAGTYYCDISNSCGTVSTNNAIISLGTDTDILLDPANETRCVGDDVNFTVNAVGSNLTFQWKVDELIWLKEQNYSI
jgi:hypothetical protein